MNNGIINIFIKVSIFNYGGCSKIGGPYGLTFCVSEVVAASCTIINVSGLTFLHILDSTYYGLTFLTVAMLVNVQQCLTEVYLYED